MCWAGLRKWNARGMPKRWFGMRRTVARYRIFGSVKLNASRSSGGHDNHVIIRSPGSRFMRRTLFRKPKPRKQISWFQLKSTYRCWMKGAEAQLKERESPSMSLSVECRPAISVTLDKTGWHIRFRLFSEHARFHLNGLPLKRQIINFIVALIMTQQKFPLPLRLGSFLRRGAVGISLSHFASSKR